MGRTDRSSVWIFGSAGRCQPLPYAAGFVIGDLFDAPSAEREPSPFDGRNSRCRDPMDLAQRLCRSHWGRYIAILHGPPPASSAIFRDPSGQMGCLTWALGDVTAVASDLLSIPRWLRPHSLALNWSRIGDLLAAPSNHISDSMFDGMASVRPGDLQVLGTGPREPTAVWRPADYVEGSQRTLEGAACDLRARVDACTKALVGNYDRVVAEISGGLDSAIVAGSIAETNCSPRVAQWLNRVGDRAEGDEQAYARAVTDRIGATLAISHKPLAPLTDADFRDLADSTWPAINGADAARDRDEVERLAACGGQAIVSGQGGDAVFYQMPTPLIMADEFRRRGLRGLVSPVLADVARRTRTSVWEVVGAAVHDLKGKTILGAPRTLAPAGAKAARDNHPWLSDARAKEISGAKRVQIAGLVTAQLLHGDSRRARHADLLYPLLAQPVVELCLSIPSPDLAGGAFDRPFARSTFADRVPDLIVQRRAKGDLTSYFSRLVAASLPTLRGLLLEGCLCEARVLDRRKVEGLLDVDVLIQQGGATEILWAATAEAWVRHWQTRIPDSDSAPRRRP